MDGKREDQEEVGIMEERMKDMEDHQVGGQEEGDESLLLSNLLPKVDSVGRDSSAAHSAELSSGIAEPSPLVAGDCQAKAVEVDEILRELRSLRRQNRITHCLLSVMIVLTVFWQFSEATFLLKVKKKFSNPFGSIKDMITASLKDEGDKHAIELPPLIHSVPELPHVEFPSLTMHSHEKTQVAVLLGHTFFEMQLLVAVPTVIEEVRKIADSL